MSPAGRVRVAAIDCGTNTIKLLIAEDGTELVREVRVVRLGQGVDRTGVLAPEALERTFAAIDDYAAAIEQHGVAPERVRFVATSATRDAGNAAAFAAGVRDRLGVDPYVATGAEEAALAFDGAVSHLRVPPELPVLVIDIGGGSTELIWGTVLGEPPAMAHSMDIGAVRLTERHLHADPPTPEQVAECVRVIDDHLDACPVRPEEAGTVVGVAGTVTQLTVGVLGLPGYDRRAVDQATLTTADLRALTDRLATMTTAERRELPWMHPGRADVIVAGALILMRVLERGRIEAIVISEADILDGIARSVED